MEEKFVIIAGTNKAATTSLFNYLADYPTICGSNIKQTNYFLDSKIQLKHGLVSTHKYDNTFKNYFKFFNCSKDHKYRLEASPDYMYYDLTINRLKEFSDKYNTEIVIILRNPVTRFKSWYNFGKQQNLIDEEMSFESYYKTCKTYQGDYNLALMAYKTGFYSEYLKSIKDKIDSVHIFFYEDLINNTSGFMKRLCEKLEIESDFYNLYDFKHHNKTVKVKSKYLARTYDFLRNTYITYLYKGRIGIFIGHVIRSIISPLYKKLNNSSLSKNEKESAFLEDLKADYRFESSKIKEMFNISQIPW